VSPKNGQPVPPADAATTSGKPPDQAAPPRPLLLPTLAFLASIIVSEQIGDATDITRTIASLVPFPIFAALLIIVLRRPRGTLLLTGVLVTIAFICGFCRHQIAIHLPADHIAHLATDERILTRIAGRIVTQPTTTPAEKRNPFLPFDPSPRTRFVLAATELHTTEPATAIRGYVRVSVKAECVPAHMGQTVLVTGWLYRPRGPRNPGETDWARWYRLQNIHAGLSVDGSAHLRLVESDCANGHRWMGLLRGYAQSLLFEPFAPVESDRPLRLLDAMVLGHRSAAGRELNEAFLRTGTIHFLTVSGFHVGVLAGAVWLLVRACSDAGPARPRWQPCS